MPWKRWTRRTPARRSNERGHRSCPALPRPVECAARYYRSLIGDAGTEGSPLAPSPLALFRERERERSSGHARPRYFWAVSSAVEHCLHTARVAGSIPAPPTTSAVEVRNRPTKTATSRDWDVEYTRWAGRGLWPELHHRLHALAPIPRLACFTDRRRAFRAPLTPGCCANRSTGSVARPGQQVAAMTCGTNRHRAAYQAPPPASDESVSERFPHTDPGPRPSWPGPRMKAGNPSAG